MNKIKVAEDIILQANYFLNNWDQIDPEVRKSINKDRIILTKEVMLDWLNAHKELYMGNTAVKPNKIKLMPKKKVSEDILSPIEDTDAPILTEAIEPKAEPPKKGIINTIKNLFKKKGQDK